MGIDDSAGRDESVRPPFEIAAETITAFNREGKGASFEELALVNEVRRVMNRMPEGKSGVVLGSGPNTDLWRSRGWKTLDIDQAVGADFTLNANWLEAISLLIGKQDFILVEYIRMDPKGIDGVHWVRLLDQARRILKLGGVVSIISGAFENNPRSTLPQRKWYGNKMAQSGFNAVVEMERKIDDGSGQTEQRVVYHGRKVAETFDASRGR